MFEEAGGRKASYHNDHGQWLSSADVISNCSAMEVKILTFLLIISCKPGWKELHFSC
jgi:hypothetical protein